MYRLMYRSMYRLMYRLEVRETNDQNNDVRDMQVFLKFPHTFQGPLQEDRQQLTWRESVPLCRDILSKFQPGHAGSQCESSPPGDMTHFNPITKFLPGFVQHISSNRRDDFRDLHYIMITIILIIKHLNSQHLAGHFHKIRGIPFTYSCHEANKNTRLE